MSDSNRESTPIRGLLVDWGGVMTTNLFASFGAFCEAGGSWTEDAVIRQLAVPLCNKGPREGTPRLHTRSAREVSRDRRAFYLTGCGDLGRAGQAKGDRHDTRLPGLRQRTCLASG